MIIGLNLEFAKVLLLFKYVFCMQLFYVTNKSCSSLLRKWGSRILSTQVFFVLICYFSGKTPTTIHLRVGEFSSINKANVIIIEHLSKKSNPFLLQYLHNQKAKVMARSSDSSKKCLGKRNLHLHIHLLLYCLMIPIVFYKFLDALL